MLWLALPIWHHTTVSFYIAARFAPISPVIPFPGIIAISLCKESNEYHKHDVILEIEPHIVYPKT